MILALSLALLVSGRTATVLALVAAQGAALSIMAGEQGFYPEMGLIGLVNVVGLPWLLFGLTPATPRRPRIALPLRLVAAAGLTMLAAPVSVPLAVMLLGILLAATSRDRVIQVVGLLAMQNGIALAGLGQGVLALGEFQGFASILPVIPALASAALWSSRGRAA